MSWLVGPYLIAAGLLVLAGAPKISHPDSAARALASLWWPASRMMVRVLGLSEVLIGLAALGLGGLAGPVPALFVAVSYGAFSVFVAVALIRGGVLSSCGCFGKADTPPTRIHLAVTLTFTAIALAVAAAPLNEPLAVLRETPSAGLPLGGFTVLGVWFSYLLLAVAPRSSGRALTRAARAADVPIA